MIKNATYLGDGVYASWDGYHIWIWTSDGINNSPRIALDDSTLSSLMRFVSRIMDGDVSIEETKDD